MKKETEVIRVAAYCRVSTDKLDQANSLESQQRYFNEYIARNPLWELYEIYVDEGITGTNTFKREDFNRMIKDGKDGKFDLIITKEVSRFARNLLDSIAYTRELREYGIRLIFLNDNIDTDQPDHEFRLAMMASLAQEESRKTSERVKWGQRRRMEQGVVFGRDMLGYDVRDGKLIINEEGAEIVRLIYHKYLDEGKGCHVIANELREAGIKTSRFMKEWSYTVILRVLKNEKYCGDLVQQKTYTQSYLSHKKKANKGELDYVIIRDHHEPIIPRERFEAAQRELQRRHDMHYTKNGFANRYALSGKIICAECGATFVHSQKKCPNGTKYENWTCITKNRQGKPRTLENGETVGCDTINLRDTDIKLILKHIISDVMGNREELLDAVLGTVDEVLRVCADKNNVEYFENEIGKVEAKKEKLLDMCLSGDIETSEYKKACERLNAEHAELLGKLSKEKANRDMIADKTQIIAAITEYINALSVGEEWDDIFYRNIIDKIYVHKDRTIDVHLKLIPEKWQAKILKGKAEIEVFEQNQKILQQGGTSVPMSVNVAFSSGNGIENRCDK
ncbi:recombinase family protein [uncultured Ruminococcus sp.]|uniref:recombinase family protein n=1 Tax=uncultured Ruminococcus sp. TaxID=165186 RepID=UPI00292CDA0E|nr:recombinase family protein [uncultured Ruminococcus sp.]